MFHITDTLPAQQQQQQPFLREYLYYFAVENAYKGTLRGALGAHQKPPNSHLPRPPWRHHVEEAHQNDAEKAACMWYLVVKNHAY
jgi:hypothetical protein